MTLIRLSPRKTEDKQRPYSPMRLHGMDYRFMISFVIELKIEIVYTKIILFSNNFLCYCNIKNEDKYKHNPTRVKSFIAKRIRKM